MFDFVVIGGGPGGYRTAELLSKDGFSVAIIEENSIGGVCLNEGCIPFKSYLHTVRIKADVEKLIKQKCVSESQVKINQNITLENKNKIIHTLRKGVVKMLNSLGIKIYEGYAYLIHASAGRYIFSVNEEEIETKKVVIATGSEDAFALYEADNKRNYTIINSKKLLELNEIPEEIEIIGGGVIGLEAASFLADYGSKVTVVEASKKIGGHIDGDVAEVMKKICQKRGIIIYTDTFLSEFRYDEVIYLQSGELISRKPKFVVTAIGRKPRIDKEMMRMLGVDYDDKGIIIDDFCKTSNSDVYACGDVTGKLMLAHVAYHQAKVIAGNVKEKNTKTYYDTIPQIIYSNPEILTVGYTEEDCISKGINYVSKTLPMTFSGRYYAENGKDGAIAKMIVDDKHHIIGFHMIGNGASEISLSVEIMLLKQLSYEEITDIVFPHPTYSEIILELARCF